MLKIDVYMDHVIVEGQTIYRPISVARSDWMRFWERMYQYATAKRSR